MPTAVQREITRIPLTPIRKAIARNMFNSLHSMAQTSDSVEIDVTELMALRQRLLAHKDELGTKITINDLLSYAAVKMLKTHPAGQRQLLRYRDTLLSRRESQHGGSHRLRPDLPCCPRRGSNESGGAESRHAATWWYGP